MRRFLPLLVVAACAPAPPLVTTSGPLAKPVYAVAGDSAAATEVQRQLTARGWYAADAPTIIRTGYAAAPRKLGTCLAANPAAPGGCTQWLEPPETGWAPFAPPLRYHLALVLDGAETGRIDVTQPGKTSEDPLNSLVTVAVSRLPG